MLLFFAAGADGAGTPEAAVDDTMQYRSRGRARIWWLVGVIGLALLRA